MRAILFLGLLYTGAVSAAAQDHLAAAKDLYESAAYEEALSTLSRLSDSEISAPGVARRADEYRAFCLFALGRTAEAESAVESLIRREPLVELNTADASPRLVAMFEGVRKRILPAVIRDRYRTVRGLLDDKLYRAAEPRLAEIQLLLESAARTGSVDQGLADLQVLVDGFLTLSRAQAEPPAPAPGAAITAAATAPRAESTATEPARSSSAAGGRRVFGAMDADVTPPVPIVQRTPAIPSELRAIARTLGRQMLLTLTIDEAGDVLRVDVQGSVNPSYDDLLVRAASGWKYKPAIHNGVPVRYQKTVVIDVQ
jgi:TonB family protein